MSSKFSPREKAVRLAHMRAKRQLQTLANLVEKRQAAISLELSDRLALARTLPGSSS